MTVQGGYLSNGGTSRDGNEMEVDVITVVGSMYVRASAFDQSAWDYAACENKSVQALFFNDDVWFNGHLARRGVARIRLGWQRNDTHLGFSGAYRLGHQVRRKGGLRQSANFAWNTFGDRAVWAFAEAFAARVPCEVTHVASSWAYMCHFDPADNARARRIRAADAEQQQKELERPALASGG